jgi:molecular chaperone GrpE
MTDDSHLTPEPEIPLDAFEGLDNLSGPAAFKAKQKAAEEQVQLDVDTALVGEVAKLKEALASSNDQLLRTVADMDNLRKRSVREREDAGKYAVTGFAKDLLDVADTFTRALQSIPADLRQDARINNLIYGIEATEKSLLSAFEKNGIKKIEPLDEVFNPHFHEVMFEAPTPGKPSGIIIQIIEPGYVINERLLRPARVGVSKAIDGDTTLRVVDTEA